MNRLSVSEIKCLLLGFHSERGYKIFKSFPLLADDPTVMFTNATITPFKSWFTDPNTNPCNFALVQRCFRAGGSSSMDAIGFDPNVHTFFEMFGTGTFGIDHITATKYLLDILDSLGIERERLYFTIPSDDNFQIGLKANGVPLRRIYVIDGNDVFWCNWQFGRQGPTGNGLTVVYALGNEDASTLEELATENGNFIELLNLIYIYGQESQNGSIISAANPGFEIGMGIERIASILQGCDGYQVDNIRPLVEVVAKYLFSQWHTINAVVSRACADYLRGICVLLDEGLLPLNRGTGYVLRKIVRKFMEYIWLVAGKPVFVEDMIREFVRLLSFHDSFLNISESNVVDTLKKEHDLLEEVLNRGIGIIQKKPNISKEILLDTYGLSSSLIQLAKKGELS